jgi:hypothetical protein
MKVGFCSRRFSDERRASVARWRFSVLPGAVMILAIWAAALQAYDATEEKPDPAVSVQANPNRAALGEPINVIIEVQVKAGVTYRLPGAIKLDPFVELSRTEELTPAADASTGALQRFVLKIATYEKTGALTVPSFRLDAINADGDVPASSVEVPEVAVQIASILEGVSDPKPRDINGPVSIVVKDYRLLVILGLLVLFFASVWSLRRYAGGLRLDSRVQALPPPRQAYEIAMEKLNAIVADDLLRQGKFYEYFVRISEVVREYLGNRYQFFAMDLTTRELLMELCDRPSPGLEHAHLRSLLEEADLVKFARLHPSDDQCAHAINAAFTLVESTRLPLEHQEGHV